MRQTGLLSRREWWWLSGVWLLVFVVGMAGAFADFVWRFRTPASLPTPPPVATPQPVIINNRWPVPATTARAVWIYDRQSQSVLYAKEAQVATAAASLAKLMTAVVAQDLYAPQQPIAIGSASAVVGNRAKFLRRDEFSSADLLKAMLIFSANDAAQALANADPAGLADFVTRMNQRAQEWRLEQTHFDNPTGLDSPGQYASAADLGRLADLALRDEFIAATVASATARVTEQKTKRVDVVYSTNALLNKSARIQGMKTGTTELAGENLIIRYVRLPNETVLPENQALLARDVTATTAAVINPQPALDVIVVILGSQDRFTEAWQLIKWVDIGAQLVVVPKN